MNGSVRIWDAASQVYLTSFSIHDFVITDIKFADDQRLLISALDSTASVVTFDSKFQLPSVAYQVGAQDGVR